MLFFFGNHSVSFVFCEFLCMSLWLIFLCIVEQQELQIFINGMHLCKRTIILFSFEYYCKQIDGWIFDLDIEISKHSDNVGRLYVSFIIKK